MKKIALLLFLVLAMSQVLAAQRKIELWRVGSIQEAWVDSVHYRVIYHPPDRTIDKPSAEWQLDTLGKVNRDTKPGNTQARISVFKLINGNWLPVGLPFDGLYSDEPDTLITRARKE